MANERLVDLDELILACIDDQARQYVSEAVACYRGGAFRSCIVATWVAVVFDFIHKLQELRGDGDRNANAKLTDFDNWRASGDKRSLQDFENKVLTLARDEFEFISATEYDDLARLKDDRDKCAHPAMSSAEQLYQPSAELARTHLRNAVSYLLQQPLAQGKAALTRLKQEVDSVLFPTDIASALARLRSGPLRRPRLSLLHNFVGHLITNILQGTVNGVQEARYMAAFGAVRQMHFVEVEGYLDGQLSSMIERLSEQNLPNVISFLSKAGDV